jgi:predicted cytidylate kinase
LNEPVVTLTGPPGSGKTTAGRLAADLLRLEFLSAGEQFRAEAARRGIDLEALSKAAEADPSIDRSLDDRMVGLATPARFLEGRIIGALLRRRRVPTICLEVTATEAVRVERVAGRDGVSVEEARRRTREREASETSRYLRYYDIDLAREPADLRVDSSQLAPLEVAHRLVEFIRSRRGSAR